MPTPDMQPDPVIGPSHHVAGAPSPWVTTLPYQDGRQIRKTIEGELTNLGVHSWKKKKTPVDLHSVLKWGGGPANKIPPPPQHHPPGRRACTIPRGSRSCHLWKVLIQPFPKDHEGCDPVIFRGSRPNHPEKVVTLPSSEGPVLTITKGVTTWPFAEGHNPTMLRKVVTQPFSVGRDPIVLLGSPHFPGRNRQIEHYSI